MNEMDQAVIDTIDTALALLKSMPANDVEPIIDGRVVAILSD